LSLLTPVAITQGLNDRFALRAWARHWLGIHSQRLKILTVQFKSLGDTVVSIPALMAIRRRFPECELHALVPEASAPLLRHHPAVNRVWGVRRVAGKARLRQYWPIVRALHAEHFDKCVDLGGNDRSAITTFLSGAPERLGAMQQNGFWGRRFCYTKPVVPASPEMHESLRLLHILSPWDIAPPATIEIKLYTDPALPNSMARDPSRPTVICNTGAAVPKKLWPIVHWARLHRLATARGYDLLYTRGVSPMEEQLIRELQTLVPEAQLLPKLDLPHLLVALKSADAVISNDTGPMHFATALGVKTIALFGPAEEKRWFPIGAEHRLLRAQGCICVKGTFVCRRANHCMLEITPEAVLENLENLMPPRGGSQKSEA
jgi:ADP-heptose:LPS heptosyltransferase